MTLVNKGAYLDGRLGLNPLDFITPEDPMIQALAQDIITKLGAEDSLAARLREAYNYVALNIKYVTDKQAYGLEEVWQKPSLTLERKLADCEDSSFLLASLLQALGIRCRVVFGEWKGKGHAWVEAWVDSVGGILETTSNQPFTGFTDPAVYKAESAVGPSGPEDPLMAFLGYVAPGFILFGIGAFLMIDDCQDAFKMELSTYGEQPGKQGILKGVTVPGLGPHIHHWWLGILLVIISIAVIALGVVLWMLKYL